MNKLHQAFVWLRRIGHSRGFGIQSPTDYAFVRYVVNEHWPYHAYDQLPANDSPLRQKLGRLYLRIANHLQPTTIVDTVGMHPYLQAGCHRAVVTGTTDEVIQLAVVPIGCNYQALFEQCDGRSVVVFQDISQAFPRWHTIENDPRVTITFDLYYCGIVMFDPKRSRHNYVINF